MIKKIRKIMIWSVALMVMLFLFGCEKNLGKIIVDQPFYSLQSAYNQRWLSKANLKAIANFQGKDNYGNLNEQVESAIKLAYLTRYPQEGNVDVMINRYLGTYDNCVAVMIGYANSQYADRCWSETVAGIKFEYNNSQRILIWKE